MTRVADRAGLERTHLYRKLKQLGVAEVFTPGSPTDAIVEFIRDAAGEPSSA